MSPSFKCLLDRKRDFPRPVCTSSFYDSSDLKAHIWSRMKEKSFPCHQCNFKTHCPSSLRQHVKNLHQREIDFKCSFPGCDFCTKYKKAHNQHLKRHNPDPIVQRPLPCTFTSCQHRSTNRYGLTNDIDARHKANRVKKFSCNLCTRTFYTLWQ